MMAEGNRNGAAKKNHDRRADGVNRATSDVLIAQLQISRDTTQLLGITQDKSYPPEIWLEAAKAALPFCHQPKDEISMPPETPLRRPLRGLFDERAT